MKSIVYHSIWLYHIFMERPFDFIKQIDTAHLLNSIYQEHPQTIALILSWLEPEKAAIIFQNLPNRISDLTRRIACMDRVNPEILRAVERVLEKKLSALSSEDYEPAGGVESIVEILNRIDHASEKQTIAALEYEDPELAEELRKRIFLFEDIVILDDLSIEKVIRKVDLKELANALTGMDTEVQDKVFRNMSKRAAGRLKKNIGHMGKVRLKDMEDAQQKIVLVIRHLESSGEISIQRGSEDMPAAGDTTIPNETISNETIPGETIPDEPLSEETPKNIEKDNGVEVLSRNEIDSLLNAIKAGEDESEEVKPAADTRKIKYYDFTRPDKFPKEQLRTVSIMHATFARLTTASLSAQLRTMVHVHVASVDQLTFEEFIRSIPTPTTLAIINMDPLRGSALLEIDPSVTFSIIDRLLGGTGESSEQHELTDIESSVMEVVIIRILKNLREAWHPVIDLRPSIRQIDTISEYAQITSPTDMVFLVTLEVRVGDVEGIMTFCVPYLTIEPIVNKFSVEYWFSSHRATHYYSALRVKLAAADVSAVAEAKDIPIKMAAEIFRQKYTIKEAAEWKEGTILLPWRPIVPDHCYLNLENKRVWHCKILEDTKSFPKKIQVTGLAENPNETEGNKMEKSMADSVVATALSDAKITISVELGTTVQTIKEVMNMGEGTIVELNKLAGEPVDVKANDVYYAKGEVVVIDEMFGVRITEICDSVYCDGIQEPKEQDFNPQ